MRLLVHLSSGIGNIVLATPLLQALHDLGAQVELLIEADYSETAGLFDEWSRIEAVYRDFVQVPEKETFDWIIPATPPYYWKKFRHRFARFHNVLSRPPDSLFYANEQAYYISFAEELGFSDHHYPDVTLPIYPTDRYGISTNTLVLAPGINAEILGIRTLISLGVRHWNVIAKIIDGIYDLFGMGNGQIAGC